MKKIAIIIFSVLSVVSLCACGSSSATAGQSWAHSEELLYEIYDDIQDDGNEANDVSVGDARFVTKSSIANDEKTDLPENIRSYASSADTKVTTNITINEKYDINTVYYSKVYRVLASVRRYHDVTDSSKDYVLTSYHEGKYYHYTLSYPNNDKIADKSGKLKVGSSGYTEYEFLYFYIRCNDVSSLQSSAKTVNPFTDSVYSLTCQSAADASVTTKSSLGTVACNTVTINNSDTPVGKGITVYYLPDKSPYNSYGDGSIIKSKKIPTKIVENNLTYTLKSFSAGA